MVAAVADALVIVSVVGVESPLPGFALVTRPAHPLNPRVIRLKETAASRPRNLFFVFVVERIVVNIRFPPLSAACTQVAGAFPHA